MIKTVLLGICLITLSFQTTDPIQNIQQKFKDINAKLKTYTALKKNEDGISAQGANITSYSDASGFKMIEETVYNTMSQTRTALYFDQQNLILVYYRHYEYKVAMYDSTFDFQDSKVTTTRDYFSQRKLIKWEAAKAKDSLSKQYKDEQAAWLDYSDDLVKQMTKEQAKRALEQ